MRRELSFEMKYIQNVVKSPVLERIVISYVVEDGRQQDISCSLPAERWRNRLGSLSSLPPVQVVQSCLSLTGTSQ